MNIIYDGSGPNTETHIESRKALQERRLTRTKSVLAGMAIGAIGVGLPVGINALTHSDEAAADFNAKATLPSAEATVTLHYEELTVGKGDTLWGIAGRVNAAANRNDTINALEAANPGVTPNTIQPGEIINVPIDISDHDLSK